MTEIFVDTILIENNLKIGVSTFDKTVIKNLETIFDNKIISYFTNLIKNNPNEAFYTFDKFQQFVVQLDYKPALGLTMKFMDFQNNDDIALDEYNILKENNWKSEDLQRIMEYYTEVKESKLNNAILVDLKSFG